LVVLGIVAKPDPAFGASDDDDPSRKLRGECDAARIEMRKDIAKSPGVSGIATPFIVRHAGEHANSILRSGESMTFTANERNAKIPSPAIWWLETLDRTGLPKLGSSPLLDGGVVHFRRLRSLDELLRQDGGTEPSEDIVVPPDSMLVIIKADVPEAKNPSTCDAQLRNGDFVFVRTFSHPMWLGATATGELAVTTTQPDLQTDPARRQCTSQCTTLTERCRSAARSGRLCVWVSECAK
jgi:hypothetical protein